MPLILASTVPSANSPALAAICDGWGMGIGARLSGAQKRHINDFGPYAARAKASRILARQNALSMAGNNAMLDMDAKKRPFFPGSPDMRVAFCHTDHMSFCLLDNASGAASIDAEEENSGDISAMAHFFNKMFHFPACPIKVGRIDILRLWLVYECAYKIFGEKNIWKKFFDSSVEVNFPCANEKKFYLDSLKLYFTFFQVGGCIVCAASTKPETEYEICCGQATRSNGKIL